MLTEAHAHSPAVEEQEHIEALLSTRRERKKGEHIPLLSLSGMLLRVVCYRTPPEAHSRKHTHTHSPKQTQNQAPSALEGVLLTL